MIRWPFGMPPATPSASSFATEINANLERVMVMEQRQFISMKLALDARYPAAFEPCVARVQAFNAAFDDHAAFQAFYEATLANKTREQALVLERKHEHLEDTFRELKPVLVEAMAIAFSLKDI